MLGFVLSGGGARGAYQAGVLRYLYGPLARHAGRAPDPRVLCGTSIGALTASWTGALGADAARYLSFFWQNLEPHHVYKLDLKDITQTALRFLRGRLRPGEGFALLDPSPVYDMFHNILPWNKLYERLDSGALDALVVAATEVATGQCIYFNDGHRKMTRVTSTSQPRGARIGPQHCLASAAIPFIFPSIQIEGRWYVDGGLRQNTPISPAIELGADRILLVGVKAPPLKQAPTRSNHPPSPGFLAAKALDALLVETIDEDTRRIEALNNIFRWGGRAYPDFMDRMHAEYRPYNIIRTHLIRPSIDLAEVAADSYRRAGDQLPSSTRTILNLLMDQEDASFASFFLFHKVYTAEAEALGYEDAARAEQEIGRLLFEA